MVAKELILSVYIPFPENYTAPLLKIRKEAGYIHGVKNAHITLYMCGFTLSKYNQLVDVIKDLKVDRFNIKIGPVIFVNSKNPGQFAFLKTSSPKLYSLHKKILSIANPIRGRLIRQKELQRIEEGSYNNAQINYLKKYGYVEVMDKYNPHLTILDEINFNAVQKKKLKLKLSHLYGDFVVTEFYVSLFEKTNNKYKQIKTKRIKLQ